MMAMRFLITGGDALVARANLRGATPRPGAYSPPPTCGHHLAPLSAYSLGEDPHEAPAAGTHQARSALASLSSTHALVDHSTLGTVAFTKRRQRRFRSVLPPGTADQPLAFWHPHQPPVMGKPMTFDAYAPTPPRITPIRAGPQSAWTAYHSPVFLDPEWRQSKGTTAPPARQPNRPSRHMTPLRLLHQLTGRRAILGPPPRRSARHRAVTPQSLRTGLPPGRPPDSSPMAGLRSSPV